MDRQIKSRRYPTPRAVAEAVVAKLEDRDIGHSDLLAAIDIGLAQADRGDFVEFDADQIIASRKSLRAKVATDARGCAAGSSDR